MNHDVRIYYWGNLRGQPCKSNAITKGVMTHSLRMTSLSRGIFCSVRLVSGSFSSIGVLPTLDLYTTWMYCHPSEWLCPLSSDVAPLPWSVKGTEGPIHRIRESWVSFFLTYSEIVWFLLEFLVLYFWPSESSCHGCIDHLSLSPLVTRGPVELMGYGCRGGWKRVKVLLSRECF